ncbi:MAG TPA: hypothetical protein PLD63_14420, partial [Ignavibacteria bacterium]|nr:hypothetical protein [Ignavibacteria bacterium]
MKTKLTVSFIFILTVSFYLFSGLIINSGEMSNEFKREPTGITDTIQPGNQNGTFLIGALDSGVDTAFQNLNEVGFNVWHAYSYGVHGWEGAGVMGDSLYAHINNYKSGVQNKLLEIDSNGMKSIIMRPKIAMLCYGQRSDYQCEKIDQNDDLWFYSFQSPNHVGIDTNDIWQGENQVVRYCKRDIQTTDGGAGWVVSRLKSNAEQCATLADNSGIIDSSIKSWIVKPRIRIDSAYAHNNQTALVCKIKVLGQIGDTVLKEIDIKAGDFINPTNNQYNGQYLEEYYFTGSTNLLIYNLWGKEVGRTARGNDSVDHQYNKIDIKIYWYGNCDMWIDYVRVDNMVAHNLFNGIYDNNWLSWEAQDIACYNESAIKFYIELFAFSNIPCMSYVSKKLDSLAYISCGKNISLTALLNPSYMYMIVPWKNRISVMNTGHVIRNYVEKAGLTDILIASYPFYTNKQNAIPYQNTTFAKIPNTLPSINGDEVLANAISPSDYDNWLQDNLDHKPSYFEYGSSASYPWDTNAHQWEGAFRWSMEMGDAISKAKDIPFLYNGQSHLWYYSEDESHKEPTNEEIEMIANVSLTYGVRGLLYFFYGWSEGPTPSNKNCQNDECFGRGFVDSGNIPRTSNAYGQNKWEMIKSQVVRMKTWEPYIMSFDNVNRKTFIYRISEDRNQMGSSTFISELKTYPHVEFDPDPFPDIDNLPADTGSNVYLQAGFFQKENETEHSKYFMIVNRRCS